jgi:poly(A) polymerase/tRNA nucleotidyltransferase (CCA-adding enzyme)
MADLGVPPGPGLGRILDILLERVIADPTTNQRATLLALARSMLADGFAPGDASSPGDGS